MSNSPSRYPKHSEKKSRYPIDSREELNKYKLKSKHQLNDTMEKECVGELDNAYGYQVKKHLQVKSTVHQQASVH